MEAIRHRKNVKMIVTDLDGTLLRDDKSISERTKDVIAKLRKAGILFVVATARPIRSVKYALPDITYDLGVFHNGAVVLNGTVPLEGYGIRNSFDIVNAILKDKPDSNIAIESNDIMYSNFNAEKLWTGVVYNKTADFHEIKHLVADKMIVEAHSIDEMNELQRYIPDDLYLQLSENIIAMILNKKATKINGIKMLAEHYGISIDQIIAFGDDYNDVDMLKSCGVGVAVDNALSEVKQAADYICDSNEQDGVAQWIERNVLDE